MADRPVDPELAAAIHMAREMSRRRFLLRTGMGLGGLAIAPSLLAACSSSDKSSSSSSGSSASQKATKLVKISNWDAYIDEDKGGSETGAGTTISNFEKATGIKVSYKKDFNDNDEYFNKIYSPILGKGKKIDPDITCPTYWMAARIIGLGWTEELPLDVIPNHKNLLDSYLNLPWDPGAKHFMPWQAGITGIAYNPKLTGRDLSSANDLFDSKLKGKVTFLTEMRDAVGMTMFAQGTDPAKAAIGDIDKALDKIDKAKSDGQILKFTGNEYLRGLENGDIAACIAWSGDIPQINKSAGIKFVIPEEGGMQWFDTMTIAKGADDIIAAGKWMNYVYDPEHAAQITEFVQYISPVKGVQEVMEKKGGDAAKLAESPLLFPKPDDLKRLKVFGDLKQQDEIAIQKKFNDITG